MTAARVRVEAFASEALGEHFTDTQEVLGEWEWVQLTYDALRVAPDGDVLAHFGGDVWTTADGRVFSDVIVGPAPLGTDADPLLTEVAGPGGVAALPGPADPEATLVGSGGDTHDVGTCVPENGWPVPCGDIRCWRRAVEAGTTTAGRPTFFELPTDAHGQPICPTPGCGSTEWLVVGTVTEVWTVDPSAIDPAARTLVAYGKDHGVVEAMSAAGGADRAECQFCSQTVELGEGARVTFD